MLVLEPYSTDVLWILIVGFIVAFVLAFGIGANDVANSFGTSVGSKVLTLRQACILATIFEILGSILIGAKVSETIRKGIIDPEKFDPQELMLGQLSSLIGCCIWLLVATFFNLPVSGTHSIVGATVGFALVARGSQSIKWEVFGKIGGSWFISPALAGTISIGFFIIIRKLILEREDHLTVGLRWLPIFYGATIMINVFSIIHSAPPILYFHLIPLWANFLITIVTGCLVGLFVKFFVGPRLKHSIEETLQKKRGFDNQIDKPQLTKTEGRFETYTARLENVNTSDKETQIDHVSMLKEYDLIRYQQQHPDQFRPYVEMPRIRKDSETLSNSGYSTVSRGRRESERLRTDMAYGVDNTNAITHRNAPNSSMIREKTKIYRLPQNPNTTVVSGSLPQETKSLLASDDDNLSTLSGDQNSLNEDLDEVEDKMPEIAQKKKKIDTTNDSLEIASIFKYLQILTAIFGAFAHGGNDVSNAIGPLIGLWLIFVNGSVAVRATTPLWVLFFWWFGNIRWSLGLGSSSYSNDRRRFN